MHRLSESCRRVVEQMIAAGAEFDTTMTPTEMRTAAAMRPVAAKPTVASVRDVDAGGVPARLYTPTGIAAPPPLVVFFHGGGWVLQFTEGHDTTARHIANKSGCAVLAVDYRLSPEEPFPAAFEDSWAAASWAAGHATELECRSGAIGLTGDSAGGNLAAAVALEAGQAGVEVGAVALVYPALDAETGRHSSYEEFADAPILTGSLMEWFWAQYIGMASPTDWRLSPFHAENLGDLPPTVVVAAEIDPLFSEGEAWIQRLATAGVLAEHHTIPGTFHAFFGFVDDLEEARRAQDIVAEHLGMHLH